MKCSDCNGEFTSDAHINTKTEEIICKYCLQDVHEDDIDWFEPMEKE